MASSAKEAGERTCRLKEVVDIKELHSSSSDYDTLGMDASLAHRESVVFRVLCFHNRVREGTLEAACSCIGDREGSFTCDSFEARRTASGSKSCSPSLREQLVHFVQAVSTSGYVQVKKACQIHYVKHLSVEALRFAS